MISQIEHINYGEVSPIDYQVTIRTILSNEYKIHFFCSVFDEIGMRFEYEICKNQEHIGGNGAFLSIKKAEKEAVQHIKNIEQDQLENVIGEPLK